MKGVCDNHEWKNALNRSDRLILRRLYSVYNHLEDQNIKDCFLYCALYPQGYSISKDELIKLWIAEGFVEKLGSMQAEIDKGNTILNKLKNNYLLQSGMCENYVKLHPLVRGMALRITNHHIRPRFLVRAGMQLEEIPAVQDWTEDLEKVSLMENRELRIPSGMSPPKCHKLTTLLLSSCSIESIPECLFEQMHGLKILDLSDNPMESLPNSISDLESLTTLLLYDCRKLEQGPSLSKLKALKVLDIGGTSLKDLPHGTGMLAYLEYFDLCWTNIKEIPYGTLSKLSRLQHLAACKLHESSKRFVRGVEVGGLRKLELLHGRFYDLEELNSYVQALHGTRQRPACKYYICVGDEIVVHQRFNWERCIELKGCKLERHIGVKLPSDVQEVIIVNCTVDFCVEPFFSWFVPAPQNKFSSLKRIFIENCKVEKLCRSNWVIWKLQNLESLSILFSDTLQEIISSEEEMNYTSRIIELDLPKLRELILRDLPELKSICSANQMLVCEALVLLDIQNCPKLKRIPLQLPLLSIEEILVDSKESWESMEWHYPKAKSLFDPYVHYFDWNDLCWLPLRST